MPPKSNKKDKQKLRQEDKCSEEEEISDAMSLVEDAEEENADEAFNSGNTNEDIMKAITSLKSGLYQKIDVVQLTITDVKKQV